MKRFFRNLSEKRQKRNARRGAAIGYVVALMLVVTAFSALLLGISSLSTRSADTYDRYVEQKLALDALGDRICEKYAGNTVSYADFEAQGYAVSDDGAGNVTVRRSESDVLLALTFGQDAEGNWSLVSFVYGEPAA